MTTDRESDQAHQEQKEESTQVINCGLMDLTKHQGYLTPVVGVTQGQITVMDTQRRHRQARGSSVIGLTRWIRLKLGPRLQSHDSQGHRSWVKFTSRTTSQGRPSSLVSSQSLATPPSSNRGLLSLLPETRSHLFKQLPRVLVPNTGSSLHSSKGREKHRKKGLRLLLPVTMVD